MAASLIVLQYVVLAARSSLPSFASKHFDFSINFMKKYHEEEGGRRTKQHQEGESAVVVVLMIILPSGLDEGAGAHQQTSSNT